MMETESVVVQLPARQEPMLAAQSVKKVPNGITRDRIRPDNLNHKKQTNIGRLIAGKNQKQNSATVFPQPPQAPVNIANKEIIVLTTPANASRDSFAVWFLSAMAEILVA
jgi:hypothetical protein